MTLAAGFLLCAVVVFLIGAAVEWVSIGRTMDALGGWPDDQSVKRFAFSGCDDAKPVKEVQTNSCNVLWLKDRSATFRKPPQRANRNGPELKGLLPNQRPLREKDLEPAVLMIYGLTRSHNAATAVPRKR